MRRILSLITFLIISTCALYAQNSQTDSLEQLLANAKGIQEIDLNLELSEAYRKQASEKAIEYANSALDIATETGNQLYEARAIYARGYAQYSINKYNEAIESFMQALTLFDELGERQGVASAHNRLGNTYNLMSKHEEALTEFNTALRINENIGNKIELGRTYSNLGSVYRILGSYKKALQYDLSSLKLYEESNYLEGIAWSSLNIARLYKRMNEYEKSLEYLNRSFRIYSDIHTSEGNEVGITLCLKEFSNLHYLRGEYDKALEYSDEVLATNIRNNNEYGEANSYAEQGIIYYNLGDYSKSMRRLELALTKKAELNDSSQLSSIYQHLGLAHAKTGNSKKAFDNLNNALNIAQNMGLKINVRDVYLSLSEVYSSFGNTTKSLFYYKKYAQLKDSLFSREITKLELQYEFDKKQEQLKLEQKQRDVLHEAQLRSQKILTNSFVAGFLFMLVMAIVIFRSYQQKKKSNILLEQRNEEIMQQKEEIATQRDQVMAQRDEIARQQKIITDSIQYASRIQTAVMPQQNFINNIIEEYFIFFRPKNIVSGDFYWVSRKENKTIIAVADCTGHGVPGAFMSMLGISFLNEVVNKNEVLQANEILYELRKNVINSLHQQSTKGAPKDGMDIALCIIDNDKQLLQYSGANNQMYIVNNDGLKELRADKMPIGIYSRKSDAPFENQEVELKPNTMLYLFSDGYPDQFGGENGRKLKYAAFKEILTDNYDKPTQLQKEILEETFDNWKGSYPQIDDVLIFGIRI